MSTTATVATHAPWLQEEVSRLEEKLAKVYEGGGKKRLQAIRDKGKMTARERIDYVLDKDFPRLEIGALTADGMYEAEGGAPSAGVVVMIGKISGREAIVVANDASVKAGAWFPMTCKKNLRAQEIALENRLPIVYLVDSAGVYLPMQADVFADKEHFGRIFRNNARLSSLGIVQIAAIMGSCVAGGAYLPIMSDEAFIVEGTGSVFLAGPYLVKSAIGEDADQEALGGAEMHSSVSGVTDNKFPNDPSCLDAVRGYFEKLGPVPKADFDKAKTKAAKREDTGFFPEDRVKPYDSQDLIDFLTDEGTWQEYKPLYGKTIMCGFARIKGWSVGIVANQRKPVKTKKGEIQMGGVIYSDSADKAARFIMNCNQRNLPLLFIHDVTGFMVGTRSEQGGIIKDGAKLVSAVANSVVPKITLVVGNSFGAGNYAMCGKAYDPRFMLAWPTARIAVMSGASASKTLVQIEKAKKEAKGHKLSAEDEAALTKEITDDYLAKTSPYYAASQLWIDGIIRPEDTRDVLDQCLEACNNSPIKERFNVGVIQT